MTFDIGHILVGLSGPIALSVVTWWYAAREKRRRERKKTSSRPSQETDYAPIAKENQREDIVDLMYYFFDEMEVEFELKTEKNSVECFTVGFDGTNGEIMMRVYVMTDRDMYQIIGQQKVFIPKSDRDAAIKAINRYNMQALAVSGCISEDGTVTFWMSRCTDGNSFTPESFDHEFSMVLAATEDITGQILKAASETR